ncbi:MAG: M23 family metallopeptidase [Defluviitaleaceae bacterium]|nr:M23 family metallopeptidase [Defluviitaleaceae bacterium]
MRIILIIPRILWTIGVAWLTFVDWLGLLDISPFPPIFYLVGSLGVFVFLDVGFWIYIIQTAGNWVVRIKYRKKMPSKSDYGCKVDYILPFNGEWTVFNGGADAGMSHSWNIVSQRYAYDFIIMDNEGKSFDGDVKSLQSYYCYDKDIIAPADGVVVKVSNKHRNSRVNGTKVFCDTWDIRGNFVIIKHADGEFSVSAHLLPRSITVRKGDEVKQGQIIGKCGNSGNTSEPHLHFQLQSSKSFFLSAGLPISFVNINAKEKVNYGLADTRGMLKEVLDAGNGRVHIGRGLEVSNYTTGVEHE